MSKLNLSSIQPDKNETESMITSHILGHSIIDQRDMYNEVFNPLCEGKVNIN